MRNVSFRWVGEKTLEIYIDVDLVHAQLSRNGRSLVIANTGGNVRLWRDGQTLPYRLNLSLFMPAEGEGECEECSVERG